MTDLLLFHSDAQAQHRATTEHPERPERAAAVVDALRASSLAARLVERTPAPAERPWIEAVHAVDYVAQVEAASRAGGRMLDPDTFTTSASFRAALATSGAAVEGTRAVMSGEAKAAFVASRPPGHHAEHDRAMGFCLFDHVAVAARWAQQHAGVERVAIVDFDVHHGNGTQHLFERDPSVFYASLHQFPLYPGTGRAQERGVAEGEGATLNCPLPAGSDGTAWLAALEDHVLPALDRFRPQLLLISAGFDAHRDDPLAQTALVDDDFAALTAGLVELANGACGGRVVSVLEGGYDLTALAASATAHVAELLGCASASGDRSERS
ncbi:histone deacetylase [Engelhardtia mirabilis]|uniref:Histone deacetylase-like amidohydrolase n=1 Tax=Engelhardtia mirabilis TaxID=2528011 RepID=A0A518BJH6_9BACT|nr:Histone deacetylase-like amidohydrolase [Planctomycetes bacterium Pla133]QDV01453.1 Histone deacetylase-like amidohydrolase [Planctomycetes bacterium Pla86]